MNRYAAASALSLMLAGAAGAVLAATGSAVAARDARLWLEYGTAGFALFGIGLSMLRPHPISVPGRWTAIHIGLMLVGLILLSAPTSGVWIFPHRLGWLVIAAAAGVYAYLIWWHPPISQRIPEPLQEYVAAGHRPNASDLQHDAVARAMLGAAPAYLFLVAIAGLTGTPTLSEPAQAMVHIGWLGSAAIGASQSFWPRLLARRLGHVQLARWGGILWHAGVLLAALTGVYWLLALTGVGSVLLIADFSRCLRGALRSRPYVVGSRRRYPELGARFGFVLATLALGAVAVFTVALPEGLLGVRSAAPVWELLVTIPLLHHLRHGISPLAWYWPPLGFAAGLTLAVASPFLLRPEPVAGAVVLIAALLLAAAWLPGIRLQEERRTTDRHRKPVG